jgi:heme exporter protein B
LDSGHRYDRHDPQAENQLEVLAALAWGCRRDLRLALYSRAEVSLTVIFFVLVTSLFPLSVNPDPGLLRTMAAGIAWVCALLSVLLGLPRLFAADCADGTLEQMVVGCAPLPALVAGKVLAHWLASALPIVLLAPLIGIQFGLPWPAIGVLTATLLLGTPILVWLGALGAALTLGSAGGATLLALLMLPLAVPVLVFGAGAVESWLAGLGVSAHLSLLGAGLILAWVLGPPSTALAIRIAFE